jgi:thiol-disulfide isomerase/thioredoxin
MKWNFAISGCCLLLLAANIALIHQNSELKSRLSLAPPSLEAATGSQMPDLHGFDLNGMPIEVDYGKDPRKVLVLVFSPTCPYCDENWPKWQQVISALDGSAIRLVAVDVTSSASTSFVSQHQLDLLPVFLKVDPRATVNYRFQLTPQTILVDSTGRVEKVWTGVLNDSAMAELRQRTGVSKAASQNANHHQGF